MKPKLDKGDLYPQPSATTSGSIRNLGIAVDRVQYANLRTLCGESIVPEKTPPNGDALKQGVSE